MKKSVYKIISLFMAAAVFMQIAAFAATDESSENCAYAQADLIQEGALISEEDIYVSPYARSINGITESEYHSLNQKFINSINAAVKSNQTEVNIDINDYHLYHYGDEKGKAEEIVTAIINDNPQLFFVKSQFWYYYNNVQINSIKLYFTSNGSNVMEQQALFDAEVNKALLGINSGMSDTEKALYLHDYIIANAEYDTALVNRTAYNIIVDKEAVCQGYALAYKYLLSKADIDSKIVTSRAMNHAWNVVEIDGSWYQADLTWDDPIPDLLGNVKHDYFLKSDYNFESSNPNELHYSWTSDVTCTSVKYDSYLWDGVNTLFAPYNNRYYYINQNGDLVSCDRNFSRETLVKNLDFKWLSADESAYIVNNSRLAYSNNLIFYHSPTQVYKYNIDTGSAVSVYSTSQKYICGIANIDEEIYLDIRKTPASTGVSPLKIQNSGLVKLNDFTLNYSSITVPVNSTKILRVTSYSPSNSTENKIPVYSSENTTVAAVTSSGTVRGISAGKTNILCKVGNIIKKIPVKVIVPVNKMTVRKKLTLAKGDKFRLKPQISPKNATDKTITYKSSNKKVAAINKQGTISAKKLGIAKITVICSSNGRVFKRVCSVQVKFSGFKKIKGKRYLYIKGVKQKNKIVTYKRAKYITNKKGVVYAKRFIRYKKKYYYASKNGKLYRSTKKKINGKRYKFNAKGVCTNYKALNR